MKKNSVDPNGNWERIWKDILQKEDGSIDIEQLKLELADFSDMIDRIKGLTCRLTNHRLSYPTYPVETIMQVAYQQFEDGYGCPVCNSGLDEEE